MQIDWDENDLCNTNREEEAELQPHGRRNTKSEREVVCANSQEPATVETMVLKWVIFFFFFFFFLFIIV
jgi:hypothetical protein